MTYEAYYLFLGYLCSQLPWTCIFLLTQLWGVRLYCLTDYQTCSRVQKRMGDWCTHKTNDNKNYGYSFGYWYALYLTMNDDAYSVWIISTQESYEMLTKCKEEPQQMGCLQLIPKESLTVYERFGNYSNCWFKKRLVKINSVVPKPQQQIIVDKVKEHHDEYGHSVVYLHGPPGTGKSIVGILLANMYKSAYCNTLKLWQPSDTLYNLYSEVEPSATNPLILVFDEFDGPLSQIHAGIPANPKFTIQTRDKAGWNQILDEIHIGMYPNLILLLTSNKTPEEICEMDPSYIREGRVDLIFGLTQT